MRFFFAFIPLIMWLLGTLALLISTAILILALFFLDQVGDDVSLQHPDLHVGYMVPFSHQP